MKLIDWVMVCRGMVLLKLFDDIVVRISVGVDVMCTRKEI